MRSIVANWGVLLLATLAKACSLAEYDPPLMMDQALAAGVVIKVRVIEVPPVDPNKFEPETSVRVEPLEYYKGDGPLEELIDLSGFRSSAACGVDSPDAGTEGIVFGCATGGVLQLNSIYPFTGYLRWTAEDDATLRGYRDFLEEGSQASTQGNMTAFECSSVNDLYRDIAPCGLPRGEPGICEAAMERYTFNVLTNECELFIYGGCGGSENNFESMDECLSTCVEEEDVCAAPKGTPGDCFAAFERWTYDEATDRCEVFTWGGCRGSPNMFETEAECQRSCKKSFPLTDPTRPCADEAFVRGPCFGAVERYSFNPLTRQCGVFEWGGCASGSANNFQSLEECADVCARDQAPQAFELSYCGGANELLCGIGQQCVDIPGDNCGQEGDELQEFCLGFCQDEFPCWEILDDAANAYACPDEINMSMTCVVGDVALCVYDDECSPFGQCMDMVEPVCDTEGNRYTNTCEFAKARCVHPQLRQSLCPDRVELPPGQCGGPDDQPCAEGHSCFDIGGDECDPAEGDVGCIGYCQVDIECGAEVFWACPHDTVCMDKPNDGCDDVGCPQTCQFEETCMMAVVCTAVFDPVCGSDGRVYGHPCSMHDAHCRDPRTVEAHPSECEDFPFEYVCQQPIEQGPCDAVEMKWAFDAEEGRCVEFMYGSCGGNYNNFDSEAACVAACGEDNPFPGPVGPTANCAPEADVDCPSGSFCLDTPNDDCDYQADPACPRTCQSDCSAYEMCDMMYAPVCGSDWQTYGNRCAFDYEYCMRRGDLKLIGEGECVIRSLNWPQTVDESERERAAPLVAIGGGVALVCLMSCGVFAYRKKKRYDAARRSVLGASATEGGANGGAVEDGKPVSSCCDYVNLQD